MRGRKPKSMPADHPDRHIEAIHGRRRQVPRELIPMLMCVLLHRERMVRGEIARLKGHSHGMPPNVRDGVIRQLTGVRDGLADISRMITQPIGEADWSWATTAWENLTGAGIDPAAHIEWTGGPSDATT